MAPRQQLHELLLTLTEHVYFQPPASVQMVYPCIVYQRYIAKTQFADNQPHIYDDCYQVTVIDADPDSDIIPKVASLPMSHKNRAFVVKNLNHDVFNLYF